MLAKKIIIRGCIVMCAVFSLTACHQKVAQVTEMDKDLSCTQLCSEIVEAEKAKEKIASKRGFSARNAAGLLFWPAIVVNEVTGNSAETDANNRITALKNIYASKQCSRQALIDAESKLAKADSKEEAEKA